jgi:hypothetical protein
MGCCRVYLVEGEYAIVELACKGESRSLILILAEECTEVLDDLVWWLREPTLNAKFDECGNRDRGSRLESNVLFTLVRVLVSDNRLYV